MSSYEKLEAWRTRKQNERDTILWKKQKQNREETDTLSSSLSLLFLLLLLLLLLLFLLAVHLSTHLLRTSRDVQNTLALRIDEIEGKRTALSQCVDNLKAEMDNMNLYIDITKTEVIAKVGD